MELYLYSRILKSRMLHYGYFEDTEIAPEDISLRMIEEAQVRYASKIVDFVSNPDAEVLDVGCGMGGLSLMLHEKGFKVNSLTPNKNQIDFLRRNHPFLTTHHCKYEDFNTKTKFGTIINSESLQYILLDDAFRKSEELILPGGKWIIIDYFSKEKKEENQLPHHLDSFLAKVKEYDWEIIHQEDVTNNILPTIRYVDMLVKRILEPAKHFAYEKLRYKKPRLFYLSNRLRAKIDKKVLKEARTVDPEVFVREREYCLFVLQKM